MTDKIVRLDDYRPDQCEPDNGARVVVDRFLDEHDCGPPIVANQSCHCLSPCDYFLAWLWQQGYKVVPLGDNDGDDSSAA